VREHHLAVLADHAETRGRKTAVVRNLSLEHAAALAMLSQAEQLEVLRGAGIAMAVAKVRRARAKPGCGAEAFIRGGMGACAAIRAGCVHGSDRAAWR
jgi:hypothetical protein